MSRMRTILYRPLANKWLNCAIFREPRLLLFIVLFPPLHEIFGTYALSQNDWLIVIGAALTISPVLELAKWCERRGWFEKLS